MSAWFVPFRLAAGGATETTIKELFARIASAITLASIALLFSYWGGWLFLLLIALGCAILCWEWWRLSAEAGFVPEDARPIDRPATPLLVDIAVTLTAIVAMGMKQPVLAIALLLFGTMIAAATRLTYRQPLWIALGALYIALPALALIWLRQDENWGLLATLFLFTIVWSTDSFAFVFGRALGGPKLWPQISPAKTWAGFIGGTFAGAGAGALFAFISALPNIGGLLWLGALLAIGTQAGDLLESSIKRAFRKKDASQLIPGHGGLLDRVDGMMIAILLAAAIVLSKNKAAPAESLLLW